MKYYRVVSETTIKNLEAEVTRLMKEGWEPCGGPSVGGQGQTHPIYFQAMVK